MRADFYLLSTDAVDASALLACRLLEKAYQQGHQVFVYCADRQAAEQLDELLWTFKPDSFIPHHLQGEGPEPPPPIQIGHSSEPRGFHDILLNLASTVPPFFNRFKRIIEIVGVDEAAKELSREHYRMYRKAGIEAATHTVSTPQLERD